MRKLEGIVIHRTEAGLTGAEVRAAEAKAGLGYHFFVRENGAVDPLDPVDTLVWHCRSWSRSTVGIAVLGCFMDEINGVRPRRRVPTQSQYRAVIALCRELRTTYGDLWVMGHSELPNASFDLTKQCPGPNFDLEHVRKCVGAPMFDATARGARQ